MKERPRASLLQTTGIIILLVVWQLLATYVQGTVPNGDVILPSPVDVVTKGFLGLAAFSGTGMESMQEGRAYTFVQASRVVVLQSLVTMRRVFGGALIGLMLGIALGLLMGRYRMISRLFGPAIELIRPIPLLALSALFILWFGGREVGVFTYIIYGVSVMIVVNTLNAIRNVDPVYTKFAKTLGASDSDIYRSVIIPGILPELLGGVRVVLAVVWAITLAAEYLAAQDGLGRIMITAEYFLFTPRMMFVTALLVLYGYLTDLLVRKGAGRILAWAPRLGDAR